MDESTRRATALVDTGAVLVIALLGVLAAAAAGAAVAMRLATLLHAIG